SRPAARNAPTTRPDVSRRGHDGPSAGGRGGRPWDADGPGAPAPGPAPRHACDRRAPAGAPRGSRTRRRPRRRATGRGPAPWRPRRSSRWSLPTPRRQDLFFFLRRRAGVWPPAPPAAFFGGVTRPDGGRLACPFDEPFA